MTHSLKPPTFAHHRLLHPRSSFLISAGIFVLSLFLVAGFLPHDAQAVGITPSTFDIPNARPGAEITREITIYPSEETPSDKYTIELDGTGKEFATVPELLTIPDGDAEGILSVAITIPEIDPGTYELIIRITEEEARGDIKIGATTTFAIHVTDKDVQEFEISGSYPDYNDEGSRFVFFVNNTGNIPGLLKDCVFSLSGTRDKTRELEVTKDLSQENIPPYTGTQIIVEIPERENGMIITSASIRDNNDVIVYTHKDDSSNTSSSQVSTKSFSRWLPLTIGIAIISTILLLYTIRKKRK